MARVRSMLARVGRLERSDAPAQCPFERQYGTLENMAREWRGMMSAGMLDPRDGEALIAIVYRWRNDRVWDLWR
ncbi:hypothetical protein JW805_08010 [Roseomonas aeriglobus]|nr:hypothetical protein [Roseomonas aeriglobus]